MPYFCCTVSFIILICRDGFFSFLFSFKQSYSSFLLLKFCEIYVYGEPRLRNSGYALCCLFLGFHDGIQCVQLVFLAEIVMTFILGIFSFCKMVVVYERVKRRLWVEGVYFLARQGWIWFLFYLFFLFLLDPFCSLILPDYYAQSS